MSYIPQKQNKHLTYEDKYGTGVWHTIEGKSIPFSEVTHQHWSNIFWYHKMFVEVNKNAFSILTRELVNKAKDSHYIAKCMIDEKFGGEILDWVPKYDNEKRWFFEQCTRKILFEKYVDLNKKLLNV